MSDSPGCRTGANALRLKLIGRFGLGQGARRDGHHNPKRERGTGITFASLTLRVVM